MNFIFGGNTGLSYDEVQRKRAIAEQLMANQGTPRNVGEGLSAIGKALTIRGLNKQADKADKEGRAGAADAFGSIFGGGETGGGSYGPTEPAPGPNQGLADDVMGVIGKDGLPASLVNSESGGNWRALNSEGYGGRGQFGESRLADAARAGIIPAGMTGADYSRQPEAVQLAVENWHKKDILGQLGKYVGTDVDGPGPIPPLTEDSILSVAHLGGTGGAKKFIESGGRYNPADSNGTSLADYATRHGGGQRRGGMQGANATVQQLAELSGNKYLSDGQRAIVGALLQKKMQEGDPMYQMGLEKSQLELAQLRNPQSNVDNLPSGYRELQLRAEASGLQPGTPEYQKFMLTGGTGAGAGSPAAFEALRQQALAAGLQEGSPEYQRFMLTKGAGDAAAARVAGTTQGEAVTQVQGARDLAKAIDDQVLSLKTDPKLPDMLGPLNSRLPNVSADAARVQAKIDQIQGGAFLQARQLLKGGGAITDFEGQKAEAAFVRLNQAQSVEDFNAALDEFNSWVKKGVAKLEGQAGGGQAAQPAAPQTQDDDTFESFAKTPSAIAAAQKYGVTLEEMWAIKQGQK